MSGIIGRAGSKSGVIGTTELDYEEGTWTPTGPSLNDANGTYTKIGRLIYCSAYVYLSVSNADTIGGLPFTSATGGLGRTGGGVVVSNTQFDSVHCSTSGASQDVIFHTKSSIITFTTDLMEFQFTLTYHI